jgi:nucleoside-diphosphate-sugar epimerase
VPAHDAIAVFGASGRTGQALVTAALARGIAVRALYRPPGMPANPPGRLTIISGDLRQLPDVERTLRQTRAVACLFGPNRGAPEVFCAEATAIVLEAMAAAGVRRLVCQTGAMIGDGAGGRSWAMERAARMFARQQPALSTDRVRQEALIMDSDRDWLIVKPPRLSGRPGRSRLDVGPAVRVGMLSSVGRSALADVLLAALLDPGRPTGRVFVNTPCRILRLPDQEMSHGDRHH